MMLPRGQSTIEIALQTDIPAPYLWISRASEPYRSALHKIYLLFIYP